MKDIKRLLENADPLRHEPEAPAERVASTRRIVTAAVAAEPRPLAARGRLFVPLAAAAVTLAVALSFGWRLWPGMGFQTYAAVRFELRLAEATPAPGLREARISGGQTIYLHPDAILTNSDIASAEIVERAGEARFDIGLRFTPEGAARVSAATRNHVGKRIAILVDDEVVMAPTLRANLGDSAVINGNYSRDEVERVVQGIVGQ